MKRSNHRAPASRSSRGSRASRLVAGFLLGALGTVACAESPATGRLLVLSRAENLAEVLDLRDGSVMARQAVGPNPHEVALSAERGIAFVSAYGGDVVTVVDTSEHRVVASYELRGFEKLHGIFANCEGSLL